jgi:ubiquinone/menaquinone biosynthesis C-methylase UbiE
MIQEFTTVINYHDRAEFYDIECQSNIDHKFLKELISPKITRILEVPCGVGRNTFALADSGREVVAVDLEPEMVKYLKKSINERTGYNNITVQVGDIRTLNLKSKFDLITIPREAFQILIDKTDAIKALKAMRRHLTKEGILVLDMATFKNATFKDTNIHPDYFDPTVLDGELVEEWTRTTSEGNRVQRSRIQKKINHSIIRIEYYYKFHFKEGGTAKSQATVELRKYDYEEVMEMLKDCGLIPYTTYKNYEREPYEHNAVRMIFILNRFK